MAVIKKQTEPLANELGNKDYIDLGKVDSPKFTHGGI